VIEQDKEQYVPTHTPPVVEHIATPAQNRSGYQIIEEEKPQSGAELEKFLVNLKERILVLFEGLQTIDSSGNKELLLQEKKLDLTINFLEYLLASIDDKLENPTR
jgi:hypothetical protein